MVSVLTLYLTICLEACGLITTGQKLGALVVFLLITIMAALLW